MTSYGHTAIAWPQMSVGWAGLGIVHCYGDHTCWACAHTPFNALVSLAEPFTVHDSVERSTRFEGQAGATHQCIYC